MGGRLLAILWFVPSCGLCGASADDTAADWPQWGGQHRNFHADCGSLANSWPPEGLRRLWQRTLGDGYSSIAVAGGKLFTMYRKDDHEHLVALDAATGQPVWEHRYPAPFLPNTNLEPGPGPHATPLIAGNRVCCVGVTGILHCLDRDSGRVLWKHQLFSEFDGTILYRGYSSSPLAYDDSVIVTVGGAGHAMLAFRLTDGSIKWQAQDFQISHASPLLIRFGDRDQLVVYASRVIAGLDPRDGTSLWQHPHPLTGDHIASMPVWGDDGRLFFSAAYGGGSWCLQLTQQGNRTIATESWYNIRMRIHHSNAIRIGDFVYASSGDFLPKVFTALNIKTGEIAWQDRRLTRASSVYADGKLLMLEEDGHLTLATVSPTGLEVRSKVELFQGQAWTVPTLVGHRLYIRNRAEIMAFELP